MSGYSIIFSVIYPELDDKGIYFLAPFSCFSKAERLSKACESDDFLLDGELGYDCTNRFDELFS